MPLEILYRDDDLIAVNKPAGQLVHPADHPQPGDEVTMKILRDQIGESVHPLHRIDRPTCGIVLFTTKTEVVRVLRPAFDEHRIQKTYLAVVLGHPAATSWTCELPLRKKKDSPLQDAVTDFKLLEKLPSELALVEARPRTGRYHQIRRHLHQIDHPIVGDYLYTGVEKCNELGQLLGTGTRMLLQAKELTLDHPKTGQAITIAAPTEPVIEKACRIRP
ncbi:MAG: pseudouridine synthase [Akkermansiaceae bacterium]